MLPALDVCLNCRNGDFAIINYAIHPKLKICVAYGPVIDVAKNVMAESGLELVMKNLNDFSGRDGTIACELDESRSRAKEFYRKFTKTVSLQLGMDGMLRISPMHKDRAGGSCSSKNEVVLLASNCESRDFVKVLNAAFAVAT